MTCANRVRSNYVCCPSCISYLLYLLPRRRQYKTHVTVWQLCCATVWIITITRNGNQYPKILTTKKEFFTATACGFGDISKKLDFSSLLKIQNYYSNFFLWTTIYFTSLKLQLYQILLKESTAGTFCLKKPTPTSLLPMRRLLI